MILSDHSETDNSELKLGSRSCCKRHVITQGGLKMFLDQHALLVLDTTLLSNTHHLSFTKQRPSLRIKSSMPKWYSASRYDGQWLRMIQYSFISVPLVNKYRVSVSSIQKESRQWYSICVTLWSARTSPGGRGDDITWEEYKLIPLKERGCIQCSNDLPHAHHVSNWLRDWKPPSFPIAAGDAPLWEAPPRVFERIVYRLQVIWGRQSRGTRTSCWLAVQKGLCGWMRWSSMRFCRCQKNSLSGRSETEFRGAGLMGAIQIRFKAADSRSVLQPSSVSLD